MEQKRIFIVEDESITALALQRQLEDRGYEVVGRVRSGEEALAKVPSLIPDLVLMDIQLAGKLNGIETSAQLHTNFDMPIVFLSAFSDNETLDRARLTEPFGYLVKPINEYDLYTTIEVALYKNQIDRKLRESEARFRALVENSPDFIIILDNQYQIQYINALTEGFTMEQVIGSSVFDYLPQDSHTMIKATIDRVIQTGQSGQYEVQNTRRDGSMGWYHTRIIPVLEFAQVTSITLIASDITERKQQEDALRESESKTRALLNAMPDALFALDSEGNFIEYKPADSFPAMLPPEEFLGKNFHDILPPELAQQTEHSIHLAHQESRIQSFEYTIPLDDGFHDYEARIFAYEEGRSFVIVRDITKRKQADKHILEQSRLLDLIFQYTPDSIALLDKDFNFIRVSDTYARAGQRAVSYFPGRNHFEVYPSDFEAEAQDVKQNKYIYNKTARSFVYADHPEWGVTYWNLALVPILDQDDEVELFLFTLKNVSEQVQAEKEIRTLNEELEQRVIDRTQELEQANQEIRHFAYIVSHDLRAPLVNLKGFSSELRSALQIVNETYDELLEFINPSKRDLTMQAITEDIPEALQFIESSVDNMDSFTKAILKLARLGRLQLELIEVNTEFVVKNTLNALAYQIEQQGIQVFIGDLPIITADLVSIEQIFTNIISNAIAYLVPERHGEIEISAEQSSDETIFRIRDNGRGIAPEDIDKIFAPFRRAGKQDTPGEGMGLAYVQTLVRRHRGRIWYDSKAGLGTSFNFTILKNLTSDTMGI